MKGEITFLIAGVFISQWLGATCQTDDQQDTSDERIENQRHPHYTITSNMSSVIKQIPNDDNEETVLV